MLVMLSMTACDGSSDEDTNQGTSSGGSGTTSTNRTITIVNNTGYSIYNLLIKPSNSSDWGSSLSYSTISNSGSLTYTLPASISNNGIYDIRFGSSTGNYIKYYFTITNGMTITFSSNDYDDGSKNPEISIKNLSGVSFNSFYIKPSSATDWGTNFGSVSNNSERTITLPFLLTNFSVFDIQMKSSNNTYTKNNVTVSNGMIVTYYPADSDNSQIINPVIVIENNTGYSIYNLMIKPSISLDWGSILSYSTISNSGSLTYTLPASISNNGIYDIRFNSSTGLFVKNNVSLVYGMIVTFTSDDLN